MLIQVEVIDVERTTLHRRRNFGEDLWRTFCHERKVDILDLYHRMDGTYATFDIAVQRRHAKRATETVEGLLKTYFLTDAIALHVRERAEGDRE